MKIIVLGAGLIGTTTAYFLAKSGHEVTIIDKENSAGLKCSYANGAQLSYCHAEPWSSFPTLLKALKWIGKDDKPLLWKPSLDISMWSWIFKFLHYCNKTSADLGTEKILKLGLYSRQILHEIEPELNFDFDYEKGGKIFIFRTDKELQDYLKQSRLQEFFGSKYQVLSRDELLNFEPCLTPVIHNISGSIRDELDESADSYKYCVGIDNLLESKKVTRLYNHEIKEIVFEENKIKEIKTDKGSFEADLYVLALGAYSVNLFKNSKLKLPIYPLKGYSITVDLEDEKTAPQNSITDAYAKVVFSKLGDKLRVAGTAEFAGFNHEITQKRIQMMKDLTKQNFPELKGNIENATPYACLRPSSPDSVPILGKCIYDNLILNTGHGTLGWTQTFASAKIIDDLINRIQPELPLEWYNIERFS
jgi:D-amino-acid dehydrogenase